MLLEYEIMERMKWECSIWYDVSGINRQSYTVVNLLAKLDCVYGIALVGM